MKSKSYKQPILPLQGLDTSKQIRNINLNPRAEIKIVQSQLIAIDEDGDEEEVPIEKAHSIIQSYFNMLDSKITKTEWQDRLSRLRLQLQSNTLLTINKYGIDLAEIKTIFADMCIRLTLSTRPILGTSFDFQGIQYKIVTLREKLYLPKLATSVQIDTEYVELTTGNVVTQAEVTVETYQFYDAKVLGSMVAEVMKYCDLSMAVDNYHDGKGNNEDSYASIYFGKTELVRIVTHSKLANSNDLTKASVLKSITNDLFGAIPSPTGKKTVQTQKVNAGQLGANTTPNKK